MKRLDINKPLKVHELFLKGHKKPISDCVVFIAGNFLVVGVDEEDTAPTWYNVDLIDRLVGVEEIKTQARMASAYYF